MSLRYEQYQALKGTRDFLFDLLKPGKWTKGELRRRASACLHHYPILTETGKPIFSRDEITKED